MLRNGRNVVDREAISMEILPMRWWPREIPKRENCATLVDRFGLHVEVKRNLPMIDANREHDKRSTAIQRSLSRMLRLSRELSRRLYAPARGFICRAFASCSGRSLHCVSSSS